MLLGGDCETNYVSGWRRQNSTELKLQQRRRRGRRFTERGEARYGANLGLLTSFTEPSERGKLYFLPLLNFFGGVGCGGGMGVYSCAADSEIEAPLMEVGVIKKM